jgi:uncharacterized repeat protein (TIGR01451 family)
VLKAPATDPVGIGSAATFNITVTASGTSDSTSVTLSDTLPPRPIGSFWTLMGTDQSFCDLTANVLTCSFGTMAPGDIRSIAVSTIAASTDLLLGIDNTATVVTTAVDSNPANNISAAHIMVISVE